MSINELPKGIRKRGNCFLIEYKIDGKRHFDSFATLEEAIAEKKKIEAIRTLKSTGVDVRLDDNYFKRKEVRVKADTLTIGQAMQKYLKIEVPKKSEATKPQDLRYLNTLYEFLFEHLNLYYITDVKLIHLSEYQTYMQQELNLKASTINRRFSTCRHFFKMCRAWELIEKNPAQDLKRLSEDDTEITTWENKELVDLLDRVRQVKRRAWAADVLMFMYYTGLRPGQVAQLNFGDIDFANRILSTKSKKGGKWKKKQVPLNQDLLMFLQNKQAEARVNFTARKEDPIFLNSRGQRFTSNSLNKIVRHTRGDIGNDELVPYGLRHTFGYEARKASIPLRDISDLMGHSRTTTTDRYTKRDVGKLHSIVSDLSERRKLK